MDQKVRILNQSVVSSTVPVDTTVKVIPWNQPGSTLSTIAEKLQKDRPDVFGKIAVGDIIDLLVVVNEIKNPDEVKTGQILRIPTQEQVNYLRNKAPEWKLFTNNDYERVPAKAFNHIKNIPGTVGAIPPAPGTNLSVLSKFPTWFGETDLISSALLHSNPSHIQFSVSDKRTMTHKNQNHIYLEIDGDHISSFSYKRVGNTACEGGEYNGKLTMDVANELIKRFENYKNDLYQVERNKAIVILKAYIERNKK